MKKFNVTGTMLIAAVTFILLCSTWQAAFGQDKGAAKFKIATETSEQYPELVKLIISTESMNDQEKQYWFDILPNMTKEQTDRFKDILETEKKKMEDLDVKYRDELSALNKKHEKELIEFQIKEQKSKYDKSKTEENAMAYSEALLEAMKYIDPEKDRKKVVAYADKNVALFKELAVKNKTDFVLDNLSKAIELRMIVSEKNDYKEKLALIKELIKVKGLMTNKDLSGNYGTLSWYQLFNKQYGAAVESARQGLELAPEKIWIKGNLAHGLLFEGKYADAKKIYLESKGIKIPENDNKLWEQAILEDFAEFRKAGITNPDMEKIEKLLK